MLSLGVVALGVSLWSTWVPATDPKPVDPRCQKVLPVSVADRLSGRTDLVLFGRGAVPAGGGTCNYATEARKMVFLVTLADEKSRISADYDRRKTDPAYSINRKDVSGLGDAAFTGGANEHLLVARKGSVLVSVASMVHMDRGTHQMRADLTRDQLIAIGREVVGKL